MARIKVATSSDVQTVQTQVNTLETTVTSPGTGLSDKVTANETAINGINSTIGADDTSGIRKRVKDNETAIGDANSGLVKGQNDIISVIGNSSTTGLQGRTATLEGDVRAPTTGLNDRMASVESKTGDLSFDDATNRLSQQTAPTATASADTDILTKKDGDDLYNGASTVTASAGAYNQTTTVSDDWNDLATVGNLTLQGRLPDTATEVARIENNTGGTIVVIWETNDDGTLNNGSLAVSSGNGFVISPSGGNIKSFRCGIYTTAGVNIEAYTAEFYLRNVTNGIRIACSIVGKF